MSNYHVCIIFIVTFGILNIYEDNKAVRFITYFLGGLAMMIAIAIRIGE